MITITINTNETEHTNTTVNNTEIQYRVQVSGEYITVYLTWVDGHELAEFDETEWEVYSHEMTDAQIAAWEDGDDISIEIPVSVMIEAIPFWIGLYEAIYNAS